MTVREPASTVTTNSTHDETIEWLSTHPGALTAYVGEWVAFHGRTIVAHNPSIIEAVREAKERGVADPLLVPVVPSKYVAG